MTICTRPHPRTRTARAVLAATALIGLGVCDPSGHCVFLVSRPTGPSQPNPPIVGTANSAGVA